MNKTEIINFIRNEFQKGEIRKNEFPIMTEFGVIDYSETIHTLGLNYITAIGRHIEGISPLSEFPVNFENHILNKVSETQEAYLPKPKIREVRVDSMWLSKKDNQPILISEFERYEKTRAKDNKLLEKLENLLIAYNKLGRKVPVLLFVYWSYQSVTPGDISEYVSKLDNGFKLDTGEFIQGIDARNTSYLVYHCIASGTDRFKLNQWIKVR